MITIVRAACAGLVLAGLFAASVQAQQSAAYPTRTIRIVAGVAPGGLIDIYRRKSSRLGRTDCRALGRGGKTGRLHVACREFGDTAGGADP